MGQPPGRRVGARRNDLYRKIVDSLEPNQLIPEYGASTVSSLQKTMQGLATKVVDMMETPW